MIKMEEIIFIVRTPEGEFIKKILIPNHCGSSFFYFPDEPYTEIPEFSKNFVIGSAGVNYTENDKPKTQQVILRYDEAHKGFPFPHVNVDWGYTKEKKPVRTRETIAHLKDPNWIEITMLNKETSEKKTKKVSLKN